MIEKRKDWREGDTYSQIHLHAELCLCIEIDENSICGLLQQ